MFAKKIIAAVAVVAISAGVAFAQAAAPAVPKVTTPAPAIVAPAKPAVVAPAAPAPAAAAAPAAKPAAVAQKTNLNTASADDLDKLPQIGAARSKAIIDARATKKFKDWADFTSRSVVPSNAEAAIKDLVSF